MSAITDRRGVLYRLPTAGARAAEAAAPVPAIPSKSAIEEPDAICGLIGAHKAVWAQFMELDERDHETFEEGGQAADVAMDELMNTPPTTLAGNGQLFNTSSSGTTTAVITTCRRCCDRRCWRAERIVDEGDTRRLSGRPFLFHRTAIALAGASRVVIHRAKMRRLNQLSQLRSERGTIKRPRAHIIALLFQPLFYIVNIRKPPGSG